MYHLDAYRPPENHHSALQRERAASCDGLICLRRVPEVAFNVPARCAKAWVTSSLMSRGCV